MLFAQLTYGYPNYVDHYQAINKFDDIIVSLKTNKQTNVDKSILTPEWTVRCVMHKWRKWYPLVPVMHLDFATSYVYVYVCVFVRAPAKSVFYCR